jgi:hypothetical protein
MMKPIYIISGLPRSGTSMLMQILDAGGMPVASDGKRKGCPWLQTEKGNPTAAIQRGTWR